MKPRRMPAPVLDAVLVAASFGPTADGGYELRLELPVRGES